MSQGAGSTRAAGQIIETHHLHLDSIVLDRDCRREHPTSEFLKYTVEGKPRPMIIIGPNGDRIDDVQWYWVVKLTTKGIDRNKAPKRGYVRLGQIFGDRVSYAECRPYSYPENLFDQPKGKLDPHVLKAVLSITRIIPGGPLR